MRTFQLLWTEKYAEVAFTNASSNPLVFHITAILTLYLVDKLNFEQEDAMVVYHTSFAFIYMMALFGAILADNLFGKYHTIWGGSAIYVIGCFLIAFSAIPGISGAIGLW